MEIMSLAFLSNLNFGLLDLDYKNLSWVKEEKKLIEELEQRIELNGDFPYFYINSVLFIEISDNKVACFSYEKGEFLLVKSLSFPDFIYVRNNIEKIRKLIAE